MKKLTFTLLFAIVANFANAQFITKTNKTYLAGSKVISTMVTNSDMQYLSLTFRGAKAKFTKMVFAEDAVAMVAAYEALLDDNTTGTATLVVGEYGSHNGAIAKNNAYNVSYSVGGNKYIVFTMNDVKELITNLKTLL